ncbi:MAG: YdcF family protein [Proteobacteria bacterium]|nr:YdcF family protein [Pseudomonadota bacterium]MBU1739170.1 YdcF family protein [Pseudomonadota bacterium]
MFILERIISRFFFPMPMVIILLAAGLLLLWFAAPKRQWIGRMLMTVGVILLLLFSTGFLADLLLKPFETKIDPLFFQLPNHQEPVGRYPVQYVVVLGGGHDSDPDLPVTSHLSGSSLVRLVEGIRLHRYFKSSKLVLSGGSLYEKMSEAESMATVAMDLGVKEEAIIIEKRSRQTSDQVRFIEEIVGNRLFVLVTSASHMPRAMAMFRNQGLDPFPAPTDHQVRKSKPGNPDTYFPSAGNLGKSERAIYELLATFGARLHGQTAKPDTKKPPRNS